MSIRKAFLITGAMSLGIAALQGCAADRPSRNGVFNENVYLRKAFIIRAGEVNDKGEAAPDPGWILQTTIMQTSTPNPLGAAFFVSSGINNNGSLVRFIANQDHLQMVNQRELADLQEIKDQKTRVPEQVASWPATHVDIKYRVNLDGEKTNFLEENQENDWKQRQYVKVDLNSPDLHVFTPFGNYMTYVLDACTDVATASTSIVPGSVHVAEDQDYLEWTTQTNLKLRFDNEACVQAYGEDGQTFQKLGRQFVTVTLKNSMKRATPTDKITYKTLEIDEKDPIQRKYGPQTITNFVRDYNSGMIAARTMAIRWDPEKPIRWFFSEGFPQKYKDEWLRPGGIVEATNKVLESAGVAARVSVQDYNEGLDKELNWDQNDIQNCELKRQNPANPSPEQKAQMDACKGRQYGDVRFAMLRWMTDLDIGAGYAGVQMFTPDPRTGEAITSNIQFADFQVREYYAQRIDAYLKATTCRAAKAGSTECQDLLSPEPWGPPVEEYTDPNDGILKLRQLPDACTEGQVVPLLPKSLIQKKRNNSTLYSKMQEYLRKPVSQYGNLGPEDFIADQDDDFRQAYFKTVPFYVFRDPATNPFVTAEGGAGVYGPSGYMKSLKDESDFHKVAGQIDRGWIPYNNATGPDFVHNASDFLHTMKNLQIGHRNFETQRAMHARGRINADSVGDFTALIQVMNRAGRRCLNGKWESKEEWLDGLITSYWTQVMWHEFGHSMSLDHNFMGSVDQPNWPKYDVQGCDVNTIRAQVAKGDNVLANKCACYDLANPNVTKCQRVGLYSNSVMEYNTAADRVFWANESGKGGWAPYDRGAIGFIFANSTLDQPTKDEVKNRKAQIATGQYKGSEPGVSGQFEQNFPWKDPLGFNGGKETQFLFCNADHMQYSPLCRQGDFGSTPSEIIAAELDNYEWQYTWRNFRQYRKIWDESTYASGPATRIREFRRFMSMWGFDFSGAILIDDFRRLGILPPSGVPVATYYGQLAEKFDKEMSAAGQMIAAFHKAVIQQSSGERPYRTIYDKYFGDVTQQGIILDKLFAMQGWVGMWPADNYDPGKAGSYIASYTTVGDAEYSSIAEDAVTSMIGEQFYDAFPYFKPLAVVQFAEDTHSPSFSGRIEVRDWVGGHVFWRERDMLDYFRSIAVQQRRLGCTDINTCTYNPTLRRAFAADTHLSDEYNEFVAPDGRRWAWVYVADRNAWVFSDRDRNTATYKIVNDYNIAVIRGELESGSAYGYQLPVKYFLDAFNTYN